MKLRLNKLIEPRFQLKYAAAFACVAGLAIMVQALVLRSSLTQLAGLLPHDGALAMRSIGAIVKEGLIITLTLLLPLALFVGVGMSFRVAGPLFSLKRQLRWIQEGQQKEPLSLRKTDDLQDLMALINGALEASRERGREEALQGAAEERAA